MKIKRRGFIAMAILATNQAFAKKSIFSSNSECRHQTFKKLFGLQSHFLPTNLINSYRGQVDSFEKLGYKNYLDGCLLNNSQNYAVCPLGLKIQNELIDEVFLLFKKQSEWLYVGVFNRHEADLFLSLSSELKDFHLERLLPQKRVIDGLDNSFVNDNTKLTFKIKLTEKGVTGRLEFKDVDLNKEIILDKSIEPPKLMA